MRGLCKSRDRAARRIVRALAILAAIVVAALMLGPLAIFAPAEGAPPRETLPTPTPPPQGYQPAVYFEPARNEGADFVATLNQYRRAMGVPPVAYDPILDAWAVHNNAAQSHRGTGHHVNPGCAQCAAATADPGRALAMWRSSPRHNAILLSRTARSAGAAFGLGHATLNLR